MKILQVVAEGDEVSIVLNSINMKNKLEEYALNIK